MNSVGRWPGNVLSGDASNPNMAPSRTDKWAGRPTLGGLLELPGPHAEPFRKMCVHPAVQHRLQLSHGRCCQ